MGKSEENKLAETALAGGDGVALDVLWLVRLSLMGRLAGLGSSLPCAAKIFMLPQRKPGDGTRSW